MSTNKRRKAANLDDWISQAEAARLRGTTRQAINRLIQRGRLVTLSVGDRQLVSRTEVVNFVARQAGRGSKE